MLDPAVWSSLGVDIRLSELERARYDIWCLTARPNGQQLQFVVVVSPGTQSIGPGEREAAPNLPTMDEC